MGCAYHAGVLYSLLHHTGWDARDAASIVGTSAGSLVGALLRSNVSVEELVRLTNGGEIVDGRLRVFQQASETETPTAMQWMRSLRPPTAGGLWSSARHGSARPAILSMARPSHIDLTAVITELDHLSTAAWPDRDLRVCAVSMASGRRRVLGSDSGVALSRAVAASCAVPGLFAPQRVGEEWLVDGGVHSVTNVDVTPFEDVDEVWVIAPMAGAVFRHITTSAIRNRIGASLRRELRSVPNGMPVRLFEPGREASQAMGIALMSKDRSAATLLAGFLETGDLMATDIASPPVGSRPRS